jgi:hypothetical protein
MIPFMSVIVEFSFQIYREDRQENLIKPFANFAFFAVQEKTLV